MTKDTTAPRAGRVRIFFAPKARKASGASHAEKRARGSRHSVSTVSIGPGISPRKILDRGVDVDIRRPGGMARRTGMAWTIECMHDGKPLRAWPRWGRSTAGSRRRRDRQLWIHTLPLGLVGLRGGFRARQEPKLWHALLCGEQNILRLCTGTAALLRKVRRSLLRAPSLQLNAPWLRAALDLRTHRWPHCISYMNLWWYVDRSIYCCMAF